MSKLFTPIQVGRMALRHRVALAPMTRLRSDDHHTPFPSKTEYYAQRAAVPGTLLVSEATIISPEHGGYPHVPGIYSDAQIAAWRRVTDAVHARDSHIYLQLWALGRAANPAAIKADGHPLVSASDVPMKSAFSDEMHCPVPLSVEGIQRAIEAFATAADNAVKAGFDGVEIHGANGYLVDQFLQDVSNTREDAWGGDVSSRSRFAVEVTQAVVQRVGGDRTAIRLSPWSTYQDMGMADPIPQFTDVVGKLGKLGLAYVHACESAGGVESRDENLRFLLDAYKGKGPVVVAGGYTGAMAQTAVDEGMYKDDDVVVAFGRPFISNPDLVYRVQNGIELAPSDPATWYAQGNEGYLDYPVSPEFAST